MPEKIGKYEVIERIGRGGMGMIFKARDPVLDRLVALKVISRDIDITDELRARFFREAQACARLSHPNIVTVYDMGEDDSRLFIVMELLDGEELRRLISERRPSALEDKLAIMVQVCEGLHYAHEKGIVHRDIKPGNIMVSPTGQAKILDFGIAHIANTGADLTRTGLIMGTLRYISPEQVRGRADRRSDIFSLASVFYEFLGSRPPFTGEDPMQLLEQLRTEDPPSLTEIDAGIPPDLSAVIGRAMRKDPAERYPDLEQMGGELGEIRRGLIEKAHWVRTRVREQRGQLVALHSRLEELVGRASDAEAIPVLDERGRLATMLALEGDLAKRVDDVQAKIERANVLAPAVQRGLDLFAAGEFSDAVMELEAIVADMPEHTRAAEALGQAQARVSAERRRLLAAELMENARAALADGAYALCLEILKQAAEIPPPEDAAVEVASLREAAQAALTAQEAVQRMRQQADRAREQMAQARGTARVYAATPYAAALWEEAETKANTGQAALARNAYAEAQEAFSGAETAYRVFEKAAREAQVRDREAVERARQEMSQLREHAREAGAHRYASGLWDSAEAKGNEAQRAVGAGPLARARADFIEAGALYRQAEDVANTFRESQRLRAEGARDHATLGRQQAVDADVLQRAPELWSEANSKVDEAEALLAREEYAQATEAFTAVLALYRRAESLAREVRQHQQQQSERARQIMSDSRRSAEAIDARGYALAAWDEAESSAAAGEAAFSREVYTDAAPSFERATAAYREAEGVAREAIRAREAARTHVESAREATTLARRGAAEAGAFQHASKPWLAAESVEAQAKGALDRQDYAAARTLFTDARRLYGAAAQAAGVAQEAEARRIDAMMADSRRLFASGDFEACLRRLGEVLKLRPEHAGAKELGLEAEGRARQGETAAAEAETRYAVRGTDDLEHTRLLDEPAPTLLPAAGEALATPVPSTLADATVLAEGTLHAEAPTIVAGPPGMTGAVVTDSASEAADVASLETVLLSSPSPSPDAMAVPSERRPRVAPPGENRRRLVVGKRSIAGALSAIAVIVFAVIYLPQLVVQPTPLPPPPSLEGLSKQVTAEREAASRVGAGTLPQFSRATGKQKDADAALARKDVKAAEQWYQEALESFRQAKSAAERASATARAAQDRAADARKAAESAGAPGRAALLWAKAETAQREAETALDQRTFDRAQTLFGEAERGYREAEHQAGDHGRADADAARKLAGSARKDGERADARRLAPASFASAQQKEDEAVVSLDRRDWLSATAGFKEAVRIYKQAVLDAAANRRVFQRQEALQAQERVTSAWRDAEQAAAGQRAAVLFAWGERKQREARAAFGRSEYDEAARLFWETQADYEAAAQEAKRGDGGTAGRPSAEQEQRRTALHRERAIKVGAERLAQDRFIIARAKEAGADELMRQLSFPLAAQSYGEAGDRYLDAARRAGERFEANTARTRMQAEKQRASQNAPEYGAALTEEEYGTSAYELLAYKEAKDRFTTALTFYAKAAAKKVAGSAPSPPRADGQPGALLPRKH